jgi:hypothetical protein
MIYQDVQNHPKSNNHPQIILKSSTNHEQIIPKPSPNQQQIIPKSSTNLANIIPKPSQNQPKSFKNHTEIPTSLSPYRAP